MTELSQYVGDAQWRRTVAERLGQPSLATTATTGFLYIPTCAGVPTGMPEVQPGMMPLVANSLTGVVYRHDGVSWAAVGP